METLPNRWGRIKAVTLTWVLQNPVNAQPKPVGLTDAVLGVAVGFERGMEKNPLYIFKPSFLPQLASVSSFCGLVKNPPAERLGCEALRTPALDDRRASLREAGNTPMKLGREITA